MSYAHNDLPGYIDNVSDGDKDINGSEQIGARAALFWEGDAFDLISAMRQTIDADNTRRPRWIRTPRSRFSAIWWTGPVDAAVLQGRRPTSLEPGLGLRLGRFGLRHRLFADDTTTGSADSTILFGEFANMLLGLAGAGQLVFDIDLDLDKFSQEFRLASKNGAPFEWMAGLLLHRGRRLADPDAVLEPARRLSRCRRPCDETSSPWPSSRFRATTRNLRSSRMDRSVSTSSSSSTPACARRDNEQVSRRMSRKASCCRSPIRPTIPVEDVFTWSLSPQFKLNEDSRCSMHESRPVINPAARTCAAVACLPRSIPPR